MSIFTSSNGQSVPAYPERPIKVLVGASPGGVTDILARLLGDKLGESFKQPFLVQNMPGASGSIAAAAAARSPADGYTLILTSGVLVQLPQMMKTPYEPFTDFAPVAQIGRSDLVLLVNASNPARNLAEFIDAAKKERRAISYGSPGAGTVYHLTFELLRKSAGVEVIQVPYKGAAQISTDLLGGQIESALVDMTNARALVNSGRLKALAIASEHRSPFLPQVPTFAEQGHPSVLGSSVSWILAPARIPPLVLERLSREIRNVLTQRDVVSRMAELGFETAPSTPAELALIMRREHAKWKTVITEANIKLE